MHFLSFARKDRGIVIDADLRFISGFILEQFSAENKAIKKEEMCKTENRGDDVCCNGDYDQTSINSAAPIKRFAPWKKCG